MTTVEHKPLSGQEVLDLVEDCRAFLKKVSKLDEFCGSEQEENRAKAELWKVWEAEWKINTATSESTDDLMCRLGIGRIKRTIAKKAAPTTKVAIVGKEVSITTHFPMKIVKGGMISVEPGTTEQPDDEPKTIWHNHSCLHHDGILYQKRTSECGVMFDIRKIVTLADGRRQMHFLWSFENKDGMDHCLRILDEIKISNIMDSEFMEKVNIPQPSSEAKEIIKSWTDPKNIPAIKEELQADVEARLKERRSFWDELPILYSYLLFIGAQFVMTILFANFVGMEHFDYLGYFFAFLQVIYFTQVLPKQEAELRDKESEEKKKQKVELEDLAGRVVQANEKLNADRNAVSSREAKSN